MNRETRVFQAELESILNVLDLTEVEPSPEQSERFLALCERWLETDAEEFFAWFRGFRDDAPESPEESQVRRFLEEFGPHATFQDMRDFVAREASEQAPA